jgi:hypothetical protein
VGVVAVEILRLSQVVRRVIFLFDGEVGVIGAGGVIGLEHSAMEFVRDGGASVNPVARRVAGLKPVVGGVGRALLWPRGAEKAEPMSERVSERTRMRIDGAM